MTEGNKLRILYFLAFACTASWLPIFADYLKGKGLSGIQIGTVLSITPIMMFLVQPIYGMFADRFGIRKCLTWSALFAAVSFMMYLLNVGFAGILIITIFMSLFYNSIQPLLDSLALNLVQSNPNFSYGTLRIAGAAGWAITGSLVGWNIDLVSINVIFVFSAVSMFLTFVFALSFSQSLKDQNHVKRVPSTTVNQVFSNQRLIIFLVCVVLISAGGTTIWNFYSIYMKENGASATLVGYGVSFQGLCELPFFYFSALIIARFGSRVTLLITVFALALRLALYGLVKNPVAAISIELLHGVSWSLFWVVCVEYVNNLVKAEWRATGQSLLYAAYFGVGAIAGNFWTGTLYDQQIKLSDIFLLNAAVVAGVALTIGALLPKKSFVPADLH